MSNSSTIQTVQAPVENASGTDSSLSGWIFERVKAFLSGRVLEISNGAGHLAAHCAQNGTAIEVLPFNLNDELLSITSSDLIEAFDSVIVLNATHQVLNNNRQAIANCAKLLKDRGHIIIQLPACTALYNGLDQGFSRWKLYNVAFIYNILYPDFRIAKVRYFMVSDELPFPISRTSKYSTRMELFKKENAVDFEACGLFAIVIGEKR